MFRWTCSTLALLAAGIPAAAMAQTAGQPEEILVTATKRETVLRDVPVAVQVFTERAIERANITRPGDFIGLTSNVSLQTMIKPGEADVSIRGVQGNYGLQQPVALVIDGIVSANQNALDQELFNIQQIEVAKGPQGALYGRNANAGAIIINTKRPGDQFEGKLIAGIGNGGSVKAQGLISGPIVPGQLYARLAASHTDRDGYWYNFAVGHPADFYREQIVDGRVIWEPGEALTVDLRLRGSQIKAGGQFFTPQVLAAGIKPDNNNDFPAIQQNNNQPQKQERADASVKIDYRLPFATLTAIGSYARYELEEFGDGAINPLVFSNPAAFFASSPRLSPGYSYSTADGNAWGDSVQWDRTAELRLVSPSQQRLRWMAGGYYANTARNRAVTNHIDKGGVIIPGIVSPSQFDPNGANPQTGGRLDRDISRDYAVFGQVQYDLLPSLELSAALRWDKETRENRNILLYPINAFTGVARESNFYALQPKYTLRWKATDDVSVYGSYGRGFRSGGFNNAGVTNTIRTVDGFPGFPNADSYRAETSDAYEIGLKSQWLDRRLTANLAGFWTDISNAQSFTAFPISVTTITINLDKVRSRGVEAELSYRLTDELRITESFGLIDTKIQKVVIATAVGNRVPGTPKYSNVVTLDYERPLTGSLSLSARVDWKRLGPTWYDVYNSPGTARNTFDLVNARLALLGERGNGDSWQLALWAKNVFNKYYNEYAAPAGVFGNFPYRGTPRQFGADLSWKF